ncbi:hypothetical protein ACXR2W_00840 [Leucobacter sp. HY1908]
MASRKHLVAVNRMIRAADLDALGLDAAIVELARDCARDMDAAGSERPLNLVRAYQSSLKDLQRAAERVAAAKVLPRVRAEDRASGVPDAPVEPDAAESFFE